MPKVLSYFTKLSTLLFSIACSVTLLFGITNAQAATPKQELLQYVNQYSGFSADYTQTALSPKGKVTASSSGQILAKKPGYLLLHTTAPNELFLSVMGTKILNYDPFVEQVTISRLTSTNSIPFLYLLNNKSSDWNNVIVTRVNSKVGTCFDLTSKKISQNISKLEVCVTKNGHALSQVTIFEKNGTANRYQLSNFKNTNLSTNDFIVDYPADTQVKDLDKQ